MDSWFQWQGTDLILRVRLQPGSRRDEIVEIHNNALKIRITAPPVEGKANSYLCRYLAGICKVRKTSVQITSGQTNRHKTVRIQLPEQKLPDFFSK